MLSLVSPGMWGAERRRRTYVRSDVPQACTFMLHNSELTLGVRILEAICIGEQSKQNICTSRELITCVLGILMSMLEMRPVSSD
jgi:hypothetical protein